MKQISNNPYKGTSDWYPDEYAIRKAIFDVWREVCSSYGFSEYLTPVVEAVELYEAKSGEDVGGKELMRITDKAGRKIAIRPEMTPSVTRLISKIYESTPKPIKYFSIANFMRAEKPQRGRNREFWQLNFDIFGTESVNADFEIVQMSIEIMLAFNPPEDSFILFLNHRQLIRDLLEKELDLGDKQTMVMRLMDKYGKLSREDFKEAIFAQVGDQEVSERILRFLESRDKDDLIKEFPKLKESRGLKELDQLLEKLDDIGLAKYVRFKSSLVRGLDYYDGIVLEVFDNHPQNNRALFGGGRYNSLGNIFGAKDIPAVGVAPGDETLRIFLESWDLLNQLKTDGRKKVFLPLLDEHFFMEANKLARDLRNQGYIVNIGLDEMKLGKAIGWADSNNYEYVAILGSEELKERKYLMKDLRTGQQKDYQIRA